MNHCVKCDSCKQMYDITNNSSYKNKCKKCYKKEYYQKNKQKINQQRKGKGKEYSKEYYKQNKHNILEKQKEYYKQSKKAKKRSRICNWKKIGLICEDYDQVYQLWSDSTHCDTCGSQYTKQNPKNMEHCHKTGAFRGIVCHQCNNNMLDVSKSKNNRSGHKNICYCKTQNKYKYQKVYYGKRISSKQFKTKVDCLCFKYIMLLRIRAGHFD